MTELRDALAVKSSESTHHMQSMRMLQDKNKHLNDEVGRNLVFVCLCVCLFVCYSQTRVGNFCVDLRFRVKSVINMEKSNLCLTTMYFEE